MPGHHRSTRRTDWSKLGIRLSALLTLVVGVGGGLYLDQGRAAQTRAAEVQVFEQSQINEQQVIKAHHAAWRKEIAAQEAAQAKAEAELAAAEARRKAAEEASRSSRPTPPPSFGPIPASCQEYSGNRAIGCSLMLEAGYGLDQMPCLEKLWTKESGWNHLSSNSSSGAFGIPQALPGSKMATAGSDWQTNPATQIRWGLGYIRARYSTPCGAWQHFLNNNWY